MSPSSHPPLPTTVMAVETDAAPSTLCANLSGFWYTVNIVNNTSLCALQSSKQHYITAILHRNLFTTVQYFSIGRLHSSKKQTCSVSMRPLAILTPSFSSAIQIHHSCALTPKSDRVAQS